MAMLSQTISIARLCIYSGHIHIGHKTIDANKTHFTFVYNSQAADACKPIIFELILCHLSQELVPISEWHSIAACAAKQIPLDVPWYYIFWHHSKTRDDSMVLMKFVCTLHMRPLQPRWREANSE